jgi:hypothetical protein
MGRRHGCPLAFYHHRHGIFTQTSAAIERDSLPEQLAGKQEPTQFVRLLQELEITSMAARPSQANEREEQPMVTQEEMEYYRCGNRLEQQGI